MIARLIKKIVGTRNERLLREYKKLILKINALEADIKRLNDTALCQKTSELKQRLKHGETLHQLLPEAFALVREASLRTIGFRHFDVQLLGGMALHDGKIAEMRTGEGKTLAATLPAYLNALTGHSVHIITVNDYLAKRDAEWMRPIYEFLGMKCTSNLASLSQEEKKIAYTADIIYGTNNEFGFDYLRDNMVFDLNQRVQGTLHYAIIDEVDSILIDEARTPLIISGAAEEASDLYQKVNQLVPKLQQQTIPDHEKEANIPDSERGDYTVDEKNQQVFLTEQGHQKAEKWLVKKSESLYDVNNISLMHYLNAALRAHTLYQRDIHYVVKNNEIIIVDEHTGRLMPGRRWSEGLHQAVEVKEGVPVQTENQTLATITFQNYFRLYEKLSGMTGTADTEAFEFQKIYGLEVVVIPTSKPMIRKDHADIVYMTLKEKHQAILADISACQRRQQPVLVGTASIESSEKLSELLKKKHISHEVLNAKNHEREAAIIAQAGQPGAVTIATNMAGRGTDIVLGGSLEAELAALGEQADEATKSTVKSHWKQRHQQVITAGGLHVLGTERHESRRIDNQLRGRSGRQGDPGSSQFYLSFEDNLLRIFAAKRMTHLMRRLGLKEGEKIQHPWITKAIENAQRRVEGLNFDIRKNLLEYDDVANEQRKVIYEQRFALLTAENIQDNIISIQKNVIHDTVEQFIPPHSIEEQWDTQGLTQQIEEDFNIKIPIQAWLDKDENLNEETLHQKIQECITKNYQEKEAIIGKDTLRQIEKSIMLQTLDQHWKDHLASMNHLRQSIHLRGYAQKNPTQEYKHESFKLFTDMLSDIKYTVISTLNQLSIDSNLEASQEELTPAHMNYQHAEPNHLIEEHSSITQTDKTPQSSITAEESPQPYTRNHPKIGRNQPCPCGSGKKYKQCHGALT